MTVNHKHLSFNFNLSGWNSSLVSCFEASNISSQSFKSATSDHLMNYTPRNYHGSGKWSLDDDLPNTKKVVNSTSNDWFRECIPAQLVVSTRFPASCWAIVMG